MRALLVTIPEKTHLHGLTPLAWALRCAGHEVRVACSPQLAADVVQAGLTAVPVGDTSNGSDGMAAHRDLQDSEYANWSELDPARLTWEGELERFRYGAWGNAFYNDPMMDDLLAFARHWRPHLVVWDSLTYAGAVAAKAVGAAHARSLCYSDVWTAKRNLFRKLRPPDRHEDPMAEWLGGHAEFSEELLTGQVTLDPLPERLGLSTGVRRVPIRLVPYNGPAVVPPWLREPAPRTRVCVSLGTANTERYGGDYASKVDIFDALSDLDVEVVAALLPAQREELGPAPDNVRMVDPVPLHALLPSCAAIVDHGGFGTFATALAYGVPQLMLSTSVADQVYRCGSLERAGAGCYVEHARATVEVVREKVARLVGEASFAHSAQRLRDEAMAHPSPGVVVGILEKLVAEVAS